MRTHDKQDDQNNGTHVTFTFRVVFAEGQLHAVGLAELVVWLPLQTATGVEFGGTQGGVCVGGVVAVGASKGAGGGTGVGLAIQVAQCHWLLQGVRSV